MMDQSAPSLPASVDRAAFEADLAALRVREKAHTREGDAFEGRRQLVAYYFMWWPGTRTSAGPPDWPPVPEGATGRPIAQWPRLAAGHPEPTR
jgi:hypothetical protein